jgi:transcriptional regulator with XRE-family HTH domain
MSEFHDRLRSHIHEAGYDYRSLSLAIGQGERYISNLLAGKSDPGYSTVVKICSALGLTPNQLAGLDDQIALAGGPIDDRVISAHAERILSSVTHEAHRKLARRGTRPLLDDVLTWWHQQDGLLSNFDRLSEHVDLYHAPDPEAALPEPYRVGQQSLACVSLGVETADHLRYLLTTFDEKLCENVKLAHVETRRGDPKLSIEKIDVTLPGHSFPLRFEYKRLLLPVHDQDGNEYVLNYSQALE